MKKKFIAIVGPTASGKTVLSIELAKVLNTEIISADSRQIFKNIPIATATPSMSERQGIIHYFLEEIELDRHYNAGKYGREARERLEEIFRKGKIPIVVGGSGLYLQSLIDGFFDEDIDSKDIRIELNKELELYGKEYLYEKLRKIDPESAQKMTPNFYRRVIRALEVFYASGKKISYLHKKNIQINFEAVQFCLMPDRKYLYDRINKRVDVMLKTGLLKEIEWLKNNGYHYKTHNSLNTVGVKEVFKYFEGEYSFEEMVNYIKQNSRRYAKKQISWFRRDERINWVDGQSHIEKIVDDILRNMNQ